MATRSQKGGNSVTQTKFNISLTHIIVKGKHLYVKHNRTFNKMYSKERSVIDFWAWRDLYPSPSPSIVVNKKKKKKKKQKKTNKKTRGPWWSYIAHLSEQLCKLNVEVSAKFTALRFLYKFYSPTPQRPCFFMHHDGLNWILKEGHQRKISAKLYWNWSSGFWQKDFWSVLYSYIGKISPTH